MNKPAVVNTVVCLAPGPRSTLARQRKKKSAPRAIGGKKKKFPRVPAETTSIPEQHPSATPRDARPTQAHLKAPFIFASVRVPSFV